MDFFKLRHIFQLLLMPALLVVALCVPVVNAQEQTPAPPASADEEAAGTDDANAPKFKDYRGVMIGMSADETRRKLGKPEAKSAGQDFYLISDKENAQIAYDKDGKVTTVAITYVDKSDATPTVLAVLGEDVAAEADGRIYKLVRYPAAGYWVAYNRSGGDSPIVSVTMKKLRARAK